MKIVLSLLKALEAYLRVYVAIHKVKFSREIIKIDEKIYSHRLSATADDFLLIDQLKAKRRLLSDALATISDADKGDEV